MTPLKTKYILTKHAVDRFKSRFPTLLKDTKNENDVRKIIYTSLTTGEENRQIFSNQGMMTEIYDKYGYDRRYRFINIVEGSGVFVVIENHKEKAIELVAVTVLVAHKHGKANFFKQKKKF